uniref:gamma-glutamylcyclotransferase n=1 Tax=Proboscia inermis TaxID=420281 RepID=A0A7S0G9K0_9STRA
MALSTMTKLRKLNPIASTPAILPNHRLAFNIPGSPFLEPSAASVEPLTPEERMEGLFGCDADADDADSNDGCFIDEDYDNAVHGVLYKLSEEDFAKVCQTEGIPFAYRLHRCRVILYNGDGKMAGRDAMLATNNSTFDPIFAAKYSSSNSRECDTLVVSAFTLRAAQTEFRRKERDIKPSRSYLNVLLRGAREYCLDGAYVRKLERIQIDPNVIGGGISELLLEVAERQESINKFFG